MTALPIEFTGGREFQSIGVRFKRFDNLVYDTKDGEFKDPDAVISAFIPLELGVGDESSLLKGTVSLDKTHWLDGDYRCYFHDLSLEDEKPIIQAAELAIFNGNWYSQKVPTTTDIAVRFMRINPAANDKPGTLGGMLNRILRLLEYIADDIEARTNKPQPSP